MNSSFNYSAGECMWIPWHGKITFDSSTQFTDEFFQNIRCISATFNSSINIIRDTVRFYKECHIYNKINMFYGVTVGASAVLPSKKPWKIYQPLQTSSCTIRVDYLWCYTTSRSSWELTKTAKLLVDTKYISWFKLFDNIIVCSGIRRSRTQDKSYPIFDEFTEMKIIDFF